MSQLDTLKRMYAAHNNGLENLSLYYVAIVRPPRTFPLPLLASKTLSARGRSWR